jgi:hypothetical protein
MTLPTQHLIRHLFRVDTLEEVPRQQLEELVQEYPSFGVGRYLLSCKLRAEAANDFREETQKTNLYFTNPYWLQWLLQDGAPTPVREWKETPFAAVEEWNAAGEAELPAEEVFAPVTDTTEATIETTVRQEEEPDEIGGTPAVDFSPDNLEQPAGPSAADLLLQSIAAIQDERQAQRHEAEAPSAEVPALEPEAPAGELEVPVKEPELPATEPEVPATEPEMPAGEQMVEGPAPEEAFQAPAQEVARAAAEEAVEAPAAEEAVEAPVPERAVQAPAQEEPAPMGLAGLALEQTAPEAPVHDEAPVFEAYYTVDYFASQGIRLQDDNPTDRLGKQLKSFTEWLKVMRRLPQKTKEIVPDIAAERQVQAIAAHSIEGRAVVTEAMAEVLAKQGMREKASDIYRKLSLLEPEKSAYFATKIEQLNII